MRAVTQIIGGVTLKLEQVGTASLGNFGSSAPGCSEAYRYEVDADCEHGEVYLYKFTDELFLIGFLATFMSGGSKNYVHFLKVNLSNNYISSPAVAVRPLYKITNLGEIIEKLVTGVTT